MKQLSFIGVLCFVAVFSNRLYSYQIDWNAVHPYRNHARYKRQFDSGASGPQIDLNITVPYIFSARLYPYGPSKEDKLVQVDPQPFSLHTPLKFLTKVYNAIYVHRDGVIGLTSKISSMPERLPLKLPLIAVFWMKSRGGKVYIRETTDQNILTLAQSEVNIQYRYGNDFHPNSVVIITWENTMDALETKTKDGNIFQIALILGDHGCFAHIVYSKIVANNNAIAGFSGEDDTTGHFSLPGSGSPDAIQVMEKSNIGIPGEWLFRIDEEQIYLCGAGFHGIECVDSCPPTQWYLDCAKPCHCADGNACNAGTGECPDGRCNPGWGGSPICNEDIDECETAGDLCPKEQPDCVNTPGAYLCLCFEYDNATNTCKGMTKTGNSAETIPVQVMPLRPQLIPTSPRTTKSNRRLVQVTPASTSSTLLQTQFLVTTTPLRTTTTMHKPLLPSIVSTLHPRTIMPVLVTPARSNDLCARCHENAQCIDGKCRCSLGFKGDGKFCQDVDECSEANACGKHADCQNTYGSYQCVCHVGFIATSSGCVDLDECAEGMVTCRGGNTSRCVNSIGGYSCECKAGYTGQPDGPHGCIDVNECDIPENYCGPKSKCRNFLGSYECECAEGYERLTGTSTCTDMNECLHNPCHMAAVCTNLEGTFHCKCTEGFSGDGIENCHETILYPMDKETILMSSFEEVANYTLIQPVVLFGQTFSNVYLSVNGLISFEQPQSEIIADPFATHSIILYPLHKKYNLTMGGSVSFRQIQETDGSNYGLLMRESLNIQNRFNDKDFHTKSLYIFTFENLRDVSSEKYNTFQVVIACSEKSTYVTYLYEKLESISSAKMGVSYPDGFMTVPVELLIDNSNIGQKGKWVFRVDRASGIGRCPSGLLDPPLCQRSCPPGTWGSDCTNKCHCADNLPCDFGTGYCANTKCAPGYTGVNCFEDINECEQTSNKCHANATCTNKIGSYTCRCNAMFFGDGFNCTEMDKCLLTSGIVCSPNAYCDVRSSEQPVCVCRIGYVGDGRTCELITSTSQTSIRSSMITRRYETKTTTARKILSEESIELDEDDQPFIGNNWVQENTKGTPLLVTASSTSRRPTSISPIARDYNDIGEEAFIASKHEENADTASMLFIIIPAALCGIWLVLIAVILAICCRRRRRSRMDKYIPQPINWNQRHSGLGAKDYTSTRHSYFSNISYT